MAAPRSVRSQHMLEPHPARPHNTRLHSTPVLLQHAPPAAPHTWPSSCRNGCQALLNLLLRHNAKSIACFGGQETPLHAAAAGGHLGIVAALLAAGARPGALDAGGLTAVQRASSGPVKQLLRGAERA
jgi:hypothetical protein